MSETAYTKKDNDGGSVGGDSDKATALTMDVAMMNADDAAAEERGERGGGGRGC